MARGVHPSLSSQRRRRTLMIAQRHKDQYTRLLRSVGENPPGFMHDKAANLAGPYSNPFAGELEPVGVEERFRVTTAVTDSSTSGSAD